MKHQPNANSALDPADDQWPERFARWGERLHAAHLDNIVGALLDAAEPLGPISAQLLWVAQPTLGVFVPRVEIDSLARWLEKPGGVARMRAHLLRTHEVDAYDY